MAVVLGDCAISILSVKVKHLFIRLHRLKELWPHLSQLANIKLKQPWHVTYVGD